MFKKIISLMTITTLAVSLLAGCGEKGDASSASETADAKETVESSEDAQKVSEEGQSDAGAEEVIEEFEEEVDEDWIKVLEANGTYYDALYSLPKIMEEDPGDHPVDIKTPKGMLKDNLDYYLPEIQEDDNTDRGRVAGMSEVVGRWIPLTSKYMGIETDYKPIIEAGTDFHLVLNADGSGKCNMYGGETDTPWNDKTIPINGMECEYRLDGDHLILTYELVPGKSMSWEFERDAKAADTAAAETGAEQNRELLGHKINNAKVYRLVRTCEGGSKKEISPDDTEFSPKDHFVVMSETDDEAHSGYGYMREGDKDTALYYETQRGIVKLINENTKDRSRGNGRTKFEMENDDKLLRLWPEYQRVPDKYYEYELSDETAAPRSYIAVGPNPDRNFEIPEGTHKNAGVWRLDKAYMYLYMSRDPFSETEPEQEVDDNVYGVDTRKYDADIWYVLREDGTGYMRMWNKYYEVVWSDEEQYIYDISGRHQIGTEVGLISFDALFTKLFKDELNEVPEYPKELQ